MDSFEIPTNKYHSANVEKVELLPGSRAGELLLRMEIKWEGEPVGAVPEFVALASISIPELLEAIAKAAPDLRSPDNVTELRSVS